MHLELSDTELAQIKICLAQDAMRFVTSDDELGHLGACGFARCVQFHLSADLKFLVEDRRVGRIF